MISEIRGGGVQALIGDSFPIQVISRKEEKIRIEGMVERIGEADGKEEVGRIGEAAEKGGVARNEEPHLYEIIEWRQIKAEG